MVWQNPKMRVTESLQPLTVTFKNKIAHAITFRCSFVLDSSRTTTHGRLMPLEKRRTQPATGVTAKTAYPRQDETSHGQGNRRYVPVGESIATTRLQPDTLVCGRLVPSEPSIMLQPSVPMGRL